MISIPIVVVAVLALCSVNFFLLKAAFNEIYVRLAYSKRKRRMRDQNRNPYIPKDVGPEIEDESVELGAYDSEPDDHDEGFEMVSVDHDVVGKNPDEIDSRPSKSKPNILRRFL